MQNTPEDGRKRSTGDKQMEFKIGEAETKMFAGASHEKATNYLIQSQQCDLASHLTEEMNKYPKGSPERALLKSIRFGVAYGKPDSTINIHTDYSPEEMMTRFKAVFKGDNNGTIVNR